MSRSPPAIVRRRLSSSTKTAVIVVCSLVGFCFVAFAGWAYIHFRNRVRYISSCLINSSNGAENPPFSLTVKTQIPPVTPPPTGSVRMDPFGTPPNTLEFYDPRVQSPFNSRPLNELRISYQNQLSRNSVFRNQNGHPHFRPPSSVYSDFDAGSPTAVNAQNHTTSASTFVKHLHEHGSSGKIGNQWGQDILLPRTYQPPNSGPHLNEGRPMFDRRHQSGAGCPPTIEEMPGSAKLNTSSRPLSPGASVSVRGRASSPALMAKEHVRSNDWTSIATASDGYWKALDGIHLRGASDISNERPSSEAVTHQLPAAAWPRDSESPRPEFSLSPNGKDAAGADRAAASLMPQPLRIRKFSMMATEGQRLSSNTSNVTSINPCLAPGFWHHRRSRSVSSMTTMYTIDANRSQASLSQHWPSQNAGPGLSAALNGPTIESDCAGIRRPDYGRTAATETEGDEESDLRPAQATDICEEMLSEGIHKLKRVNTMTGSEHGTGIWGEEIIGRGGRVVRHGGWI